MFCRGPGPNEGIIMTVVTGKKNCREDAAARRAERAEMPVRKLPPNWRPSGALNGLYQRIRRQVATDRQ